MSRVRPTVNTPGKLQAKIAWLAESGLRNQRTRLASTWWRVRSAKPEGCEIDMILPSLPPTCAGVHCTRTENWLVFGRLAIRSGTTTPVVSHEAPSKTSRPESEVMGARGAHASSDEICL